MEKLMLASKNSMLPHNNIKHAKMGAMDTLTICGYKMKTYKHGTQAMNINVSELARWKPNKRGVWFPYIVI